MLMSLSTVSTTRRCIAQETFCEFVRVINVTIIIIIIIILFLFDFCNNRLDTFKAGLKFNLFREAFHDLL